MKRYSLRFGALLLFSLMTIPIQATPLRAQQPETLTIAAANSLRDIFREVLPLFEAQHPDWLCGVAHLVSDRPRRMPALIRIECYPGQQTEPSTATGPSPQLVMEPLGSAPLGQR